MNKLSENMTKSFKKLKLSEKSRVSVPNLVKIISFQTQGSKLAIHGALQKRSCMCSRLVKLPSGLSNSPNRHKIQNYDKWNTKRPFRWAWTNFYFSLLDLDFSRKITFNLLLPFWGIIYFARDAILYNVFCTNLDLFTRQTVYLWRWQISYPLFIFWRS